MKISIERSRKALEKTFDGRASELLKVLEIPGEEVLILKNGTLITEDEMLSDEDEIELLSVISGG
ncbi:MAG: MoaD/ThiS family protein [Candidatus Woesearchaeota archaeon]